MDTNFSNQVKNIYSHLIDQGDAVEFDATLVKFIKNNFSILMYHGRSSFQLGVEFEIDGYKYDINEVVSLGKFPGNENFKYPFAMNNEQIRIGLKLLLPLVEFSILQFKNDIFIANKLKIQREKDKVKFSEDIIFRQHINKANNAFMEKNYSEALKNYESIINLLPPLALKKLEYCKKKINGDVL